MIKLPFLGSVLLCLSSFPGYAQSVRFAVLSDLHIVPGNDNDLIFPDVITDIEQKSPDFIFVTGDLTNQGNDIELQNVYKQLKAFSIPIYVIPGNHETTWSESAGKTITELWGGDRFLIDTPTYVFCGISTGPYMRMSDGHVKAEDLSWLDSVMSNPEYNEKQFVFFCHYPLQEGLGNYQSLTRVLNKYKAQVVFSGHEHQFKLYNSDSIPQVICPALRSRKDEIGYAMVDLSADSAVCQYFQLHEQKPDSIISIDLKNRHCLAGKNPSPSPERIGGQLPRGWRAQKLIQEKASVFTGLLLAEGKMIYGTSDGLIICRNQQDGRECWKFDVGHGIFSTPVVAGQWVIIGSTKNEFLALDINDGTVKWRIPTMAPVAGDGLVSGDYFYSGAGSGSFLKIHVPSGRICWSFDGIRRNGRLQGAPCISGNNVIFGAWDTNLYCLDTETGKMRWRWNNGKSGDLLSPGNVVPVIAGNRVLIVAPDRFLTILDLESGKQIFRTDKYKVRESLGYDPASKRAFAKTMDGELVSFVFPADNLEQDVVTDLQIGYEHNPVIPIVSQGIVYSGSRKGEVIATSVIDNRFLWRFKCGNSSVLKFDVNEKGEVFANLTEGSTWKFTNADPNFVTRTDQPRYEKGLSGKQIALWPSHGFYYSLDQDRWLWQRARCFGSVEDISILSYVQPFLTPMLENAGAYVFMPRERDLQRNEVIVDADGSTGKSIIKFTGGNKFWKKKEGKGFRMLPQLTDSINPFLEGTFSSYKNCGSSASVHYIPDIPETGEYAVYVSYAKSDQPVKALYEVYHTGGKSSFVLDQSKGAGVFHYLGTFSFQKGLKDMKGLVKVSAKDKNAPGFLTSDAVRFGGGMGTVARSSKNIQPTVSNVPRYAEGARYFLQYAGFPSEIYSPDNFKNDYTDDYKCRGAWVNHLIASGQEVDCVLAFHTDAGTTLNDSIVGTLSICSTRKGSLLGMMSDTVSRVLSEKIRNQLVEDIRKSCTQKWTKRDLWDKPYFEAWMPEAPTLLLELLSHQNLADMRYGLDPRFRFIASRAIYKGMGRFISELRGEEFVVQPLPPVAFSIQRKGDWSC